MVRENLATNSSNFNEFKNLLQSSPINIEQATSLAAQYAKKDLSNWSKYYEFLDQFYYNKMNSIYSGMSDGSMNGNTALSEASQYGLTADSGLSDTIQNQISQDNAATAYNREIEARDSSLLSTYDQLQQLGLNPSMVTSLGGASLGSVGQAAASNLNAAQLSQQRKINDYNQKQYMTRQLISMAGSLAAAGIGGGVYGFARGAAIKAASATTKAARASLQRPIIKDKGHEDDPDSWYMY